MARLWKSSLTPRCLLPPRVHVLLCGLCGWKVRPLLPSSALHCGRNLFFLLDGRGTDEPKPLIRHPLRMVWVAQTPHPSSVIRNGWVCVFFCFFLVQTHPYGWVGHIYHPVSVSETPPSVNRNGWSRTDHYDYPKTDRTSVESLKREVKTSCLL